MHHQSDGQITSIEVIGNPSEINLPDIMHQDLRPEMNIEENQEINSRNGVAYANSIPN